MAIVKVIEVLAESTQSWEEAAQRSIEEAAKTVRNIRSVYVENMNAEVKDGKIVNWRLNCKISFEVDGAK